MGKEATMGSTAARNHSNAMWSNSFALTQVKDKDNQEARLMTPNLGGDLAQQETPKEKTTENI